MALIPDEKTYVEIPFIEQLKRMGWEHIEPPDFTVGSECYD